ncbi:MAG: hypothetical protein HOO96_23870 [Polyangiaceae bacterium]|nr:hypothetical protein [Polyangiaceae bacterium]
MKKSHLGSLVLALSAAACASAPEAAPEEPNASSVVGEDLAGELALGTNTDERAAGVYAHGAQSISFDIRREGPALRTTITRGNGEPILDSTLVDGVDTARLLGGRLIVTGDVKSKPTREGDESVLRELSAMPEAPLVASLRDALQAKGAKVVTAARSGELSPQFGIGKAPNTGYVMLPHPPAAVVFQTWSFWGTTTFQFRTWHWATQFVCMTNWTYPRTCITIPGATDGPSYRLFRGQWWGYELFVWDDRSATDPLAGGVAATSF